ncbi:MULTISPECIES: hemagglutinin repeat-containing protein [unclassified Avibacterium]|uniref:hemagglutinin repeat-containing protein n=1 Tax=unclassified Avibacterium TaxID=2685287 RepID=UPI003FA35059
MEINLLAAKQTHQERSKNKSSGFNASVAVSYGSDGFAFGITLASMKISGHYLRIFI